MNTTAYFKIRQFLDIRKILSLTVVYSLFQWFVGDSRWRRWLVNDFIQVFPGAKILDVGCGPGTLREYLPRDIEYVGIDLSPQYIAHAEKKYHGHSRFYCIDVGNLDGCNIQKKYFDFVTAIGVLHHLGPDEARKMIRSVSQYLKPGGLFVTYDGVYVPEQNFLSRLFVSLDRGKYIREPEGYVALVADVFPQHEDFTFSKLLNIPYNHFLMKCHKSL